MHLKEPGMLLERVLNWESIVRDELILCGFVCVCVYVCVCVCLHAISYPSVILGGTWR